VVPRGASADTIGPSYPAAQARTTRLFLQKLFVYGYLNRIPSRRRLECEGVAMSS